MSVINQYRPTFFTGFVNEEREYNTLEELLTIDFVNQFTKSPGFFRFSVSRLDTTVKPILLMAEYKEGFEWFVAGYIEEDLITKGLPSFEPKYKGIKKYGSL